MIQPLYDQKLTPTTEGYIGKTKGCLAIENILGVMREKYKDCSAIDLAKIDFNADPNTKKIEEEIQKEFGFASVEFRIINNAVVNAHTLLPMSIMHRLEVTKMPSTPTKHGQKYYDKEHEYHMYLCLQAGCFTQLEADEITAIVLHEIGHNFDLTTAAHALSCISWIFFAVENNRLLNIIQKYASQFFRFVDTIEIVLRQITPLAILANISTVVQIAASGLWPTDKIVAAGKIALDPVGSLLRPILMLSKVSGETWSDSFATAYGYGPATIRLMDKLERNPYLKGTILENIAFFNDAITLPMCFLLDPHPDAQTRAKQQLDTLKKLSNDSSVPPKLRKCIRADYIVAQKAYNDILTMPDEGKNIIIPRLIRNFKEQKFAGKIDFRTAFFKINACDSDLDKE